MHHQHFVKVKMKLSIDEKISKLILDLNPVIFAHIKKRKINIFRDRENARVFPSFHMQMKSFPFCSF